MSLCARHVSLSDGSHDEGNWSRVWKLLDENSVLILAGDEKSL